ncbi:myotubularin-related protein 1 isoform x3 [Stylonychia lemnae]|uniref:Myotubularin-related protein 1 isoform x3 n=1 Tax=Stylonychia lemnae TaxID=5949 RepID=A0A078AP91_STYLE|nr:myotubularin-related protein 1 isoform x3 [Stylonychia lemnae]|eukprot:CDW83756.1 myotubularin-related protein 1 isoform x3 [Stylonychia lemnae]
MESDQNLQIMSHDNIQQLNSKNPGINSSIVDIKHEIPIYASTIHNQFLEIDQEEKLDDIDNIDEFDNNRHSDAIMIERSKEDFQENDPKMNSYLYIPNYFEIDIIKRRNDLKNNIEGLENQEIEYGEKQMADAIQVDVQIQDYMNFPILTGNLIITNYKIVIQIPNVRHTNPNDGTEQEEPISYKVKQYLTVFFGKISKIERQAQNEKNPDCQNRIIINTKDYREIKLIFDSIDNVNEIYVILTNLTFPDLIQRIFFASNHKLYSALKFIYQQDQGNGWEVYSDPIIEFNRQGIDLNEGNLFRLWENKNYKTCPSYPQINIVPKEADDRLILQTSNFRTKGRLPCLTYFDKFSGCSIFRSSQPKQGILNGRNQGDEKYLQLIGQLNNEINQSNGQLMIYDARSYVAALANRVNQGGVRDSHQKVIELLKEPTDEQSFKKWLIQFENSNWLQMISKILKGSNKIVESIKSKRCNVLVHCSDGWDRTAQLCCLAQLILDPYFRTIKGFQVLIEKDWVSFGHQFHRRFGHFSSNHKDDQRSPIFIMFLDCVYQMLMAEQFKGQFEFNKAFLKFLAHESYNCKYGTFLFDCERERIDFNLQMETDSIWTHVNNEFERNQYLNRGYNPSEQKFFEKIEQTDHLSLKIWHELYFCYSPYEQVIYEELASMWNMDRSSESLIKKENSKRGGYITQIFSDSFQGFIKRINTTDITEQMTFKSGIDGWYGSFQNIIIQSNSSVQEVSRQSNAFIERMRRQSDVSETEEVSIINDDENQSDEMIEDDQQYLQNGNLDINSKGMNNLIKTNYIE